MIIRAIRNYRALFVKRWMRVHPMAYMLVLIGLLSGCDKPNPECVLADEWGGSVERTVYVNPTKEWTDARLNVAALSPLYIKTSGAIDTCPDTQRLDESSSPYISPQIREWQNSQVWIEAGEPLSIFVNGSYDSKNGKQEHGKGLYVYIGDDTTADRPNNSLSWYGPSGIYSANGSANKFITTDPEFFELWDNGSIGTDVSGFSGIAPKSGYIWFRYARTPNARGVDVWGNDRSSPWRGSYGWHSTKCPACMATGIPVYCNKYQPNGTRCREAYDSDPTNPFANDHWEDESYGDNSVIGYDIIISQGCMGQNGNFLRMAFADPDPLANEVVVSHMEPLYELDGVTPIYSDEGLPVEVPVYTIQNIPDSEMLNLDPDHVNSNVDSYGVFDGDVPESGKVWLRLIDEDADGKGDADYSNNVGSYRVFMKTLKIDSGFSNVINGFVHPIEDILRSHCKTDRLLSKDLCGPGDWNLGLAERLYKQFLGVGGTGNAFVGFLRGLLVLYIILYGMQYMLGMIQDEQTDFVVRMMRFAIVQQLLSPASWEFFNVHLFQAFTYGLDELIVNLTGQFTTASGQGFSHLDKFAFANQTIAFFFSQETLIKVFALIFSSPLGFIYMVLILTGMFIYIMAVLKAAIIYLLAIIAIALLLIVSPIMIAFMLFDYTRDIFKAWYKQLINFALQPALVLTALSIFNIFVYSALYNVLYYDVCWQCVFKVDISFIPGLPHIDFCLFHSYLPWGSSTMGAVPVGLFTILIFIIIVHAMWSFNSWMAKLAVQLTSDVTETSLADAPKTIAQSTMKSLAEIGGIGQQVGGAIDKAKKQISRKGGAQK